MIELEDRLRDAFRAVDAQVPVPPRCDDVTAPAHHGRWLLVAAAVIAIVVGSAVFASHLDDDRRTRVAANDTKVAPAEFDADASAVCDKILRNRSGVQPRFATLDAYAVVTDHRAELIAGAIHDVAGLAAPTDDETILTRVIRNLETASNSVAVVRHYVEVGDVDGATFAWPDIDGSINDALTIMYRHGATGCQA